MTKPSTLEKVARVLEPQAWAALGTGDTLAYKNRRTSSLRKARKVLNTLRQVDDETVEAMTNRGWPWGWDASTPERSEVLKGAFTAAIDHILGQEP